MSGNTRIDFKGAAPIPVGHLVEVWLLRTDEGMLSTDNTGPVVRHVETGIVYGPWWAYAKESAVIEDAPPAQLVLRSDAIITAHFKARVVHCRIVSTRNRQLDQATTLVVAPEVP